MWLWAVRCGAGCGGVRGGEPESQSERINYGSEAVRQKAARGGGTRRKADESSRAPRGAGPQSPKRVFSIMRRFHMCCQRPGTTIPYPPAIPKHPNLYRRYLVYPRRSLYPFSRTMALLRLRSGMDLRQNMRDQFQPAGTFSNKTALLIRMQIDISSWRWAVASTPPRAHAVPEACLVL